MRAKFHLLIVPFFLFLVHCDHAVDPTTLNSSELMPWQAGNIWLYQVWAFATPFTARAEIARKVSVTIAGVNYDASAYLIPYPVNTEPPPFAWLYWNGPMAFIGWEEFRQPTPYCIKRCCLNIPPRWGSPGASSESIIPDNMILIRPSTERRWLPRPEEKTQPPKQSP
jgi:hypothetical protein